MTKKTYLIIKSNEYLDLNKKEISLALENICEIKFYDERILTVSIDGKHKNKLFSIFSINSVSKLIGIYDINEINSQINNVKWDDYIENPYYIQKKAVIPKIKYDKIKKELEIKTTKEISDNIWLNLKNSGFNPIVDFNRYKTKIVFYVSENYVAIGKNPKKGNQSYEKRSNNKRPSKHPTTMKPSLARVVINHLSILNKDNISIIDPFCGMGGFLIEICAIKKELNKNWKIYGNDIKKDMIKGCKNNLVFYDFNVKLYNKDTFKLEKKFDYMVTDIPYGKHSFTSNSTQVLIKNMLKWTKSNIKKRSCVVFPKEYEAYFNQQCAYFNIEIIEESEIYVHGSLTRKILLLRIN
ncbi:MAG: TRM11 family SAM-dependent methyltransferase [Candidatus Woesearchaeota archaeon]